LLALRIEASFDKDEILALYARPCALSAERRSVLESGVALLRPQSRETLSWAEAATLAVLPNNPALVHLPATANACARSATSC
jgi:penicillin-binding protein 1C